MYTVSIQIKYMQKHQRLMKCVDRWHMIVPRKWLLWNKKFVYLSPVLCFVRVNSTSNGSSHILKYRPIDSVVVPVLERFY